MAESSKPTVSVGDVVITTGRFRQNNQDVTERRIGHVTAVDETGAVIVPYYGKLNTENLLTTGSGKIMFDRLGNHYGLAIAFEVIGNECVPQGYNPGFVLKGNPAYDNTM